MVTRRYSTIPSIDRKLMLKVYLHPVKELNLNLEELLLLLKPLYGLPDAGDYWDRTMKERLERKLGIPSSYGDPSLFFLH